jgi:hypothetical protein
MRNRKAALRRLTDEQEMTFSGFGNLLTGAPGERLRDTLRRLFGSLELARDAWSAHPELLAADPIPGRRPPAWWVLERHRDAPPTVEQPDILRALGELSSSEETTLAEWRLTAPEVPDIALDRPSVTPISLFKEEPPDEAESVSQVATSADPGPAAPAPPEAVVQAREVVEPEPPTEEIAMKPQILPGPSPWFPRNGPVRPREIEGWE